MGCDIHMVLEVKHEDVWIGLHAFPYVCTTEAHNFVGWWARRRNYTLFGDLANVRGHSARGSKADPKGLPGDISALGQYMVDDYGVDGHSHTWMMLDEAWPIFGVHHCGAHMLEADRHLVCDRLFEVEHEKAANHRLIIWFDN